jgi:TRAP-type C4-dicarboxylate transport system permease small subunit
MAARLATLFDAAGRWSRRLEDGAIVALLAAIVVLAGAQIVVRNLGAGGLVWSDQVLRILVLWVAMFGAVAAARDNSHAIIDLVVHRLPDLPKRILETAVCGVTAAVCGFIAWHSAAFVREESQYGAVLFGDVPAWPFQLAIPLGFALIAWRYALYTVLAARGALPRRPVEGQTH